jgi:HK97 family phage portal protein
MPDFLPDFLPSFMNFFRAPEAKASRTAQVLAFESGGRARWTPRDYAALAREGYLANAVVHRAVRLIAENAASCGFLLYEGAQERDGHPLSQLLTRPNARQDGASFFEALYAHMLLAGNAYVEAVALGDQVRELYALRPDRMKVVPGADGWPEAYEYSVAGRSVRFDQLASNVPPILHLTFFHPLDDHYGLAPVEAAAVAVDTHNSAAKWNKALLDNAARPSGALVYSGPEGAVLSDSQFDRLKRELTDTYQGAVNAGRPLLLEGGLDWKAMSLTPKDMDFLEAKNSAAREIALAFGVPPMLLGIPGDNTYANFQEANRVFWRQTILPLASRVGSSLAQWRRIVGPYRRCAVPDAQRKARSDRLCAGRRWRPAGVRVKLAVILRCERLRASKDDRPSPFEAAQSCAAPQGDGRESSCPT